MRLSTIVRESKMFNSNTFVQVFEITLNTEYHVTVVQNDHSVSLTLFGNELSTFLNNLPIDSVVEYPETLAIAG